MFEEDETRTEERERYIRELIMGYSRSELDAIAVGLGLNPEDYPNKRAVAEAILEAREREEAPVEEAPPEYPLIEEVRVIEEVTEEMEKVSANTVRGMIKVTEKMATEFKAFTSTLQQNAQEWLEKSVNAFNQSVKEQVKENEDFTRNINAGINAFHQNVRMFQQSIIEQVRENKNFVKRFYG